MAYHIVGKNTKKQATSIAANTHVCITGWYWEVAYTKKLLANWKKLNPYMSRELQSGVHCLPVCPVLPPHCLPESEYIYMKIIPCFVYKALKSVLLSCYIATPCPVHLPCQKQNVTTQCQTESIIEENSLFLQETYIKHFSEKRQYMNGEMRERDERDREIIYTYIKKT